MGVRSALPATPASRLLALWLGVTVLVCVALAGLAVGGSATAPDWLGGRDVLVLRKSDSETATVHGRWLFTPDDDGEWGA